MGSTSTYSTRSADLELRSFAPSLTRPFLPSFVRLFVQPEFGLKGYCICRSKLGCQTGFSPSFEFWSLGKPLLGTLSSTFSSSPYSYLGGRVPRGIQFSTKYPKCVCVCVFTCTCTQTLLDTAVLRPADFAQVF